jgi:hypothetical protein
MVMVMVSTVMKSATPMMSMWHSILLQTKGKTIHS